MRGSIASLTEHKNIIVITIRRLSESTHELALIILFVDMSNITLTNIGSIIELFESYLNNYVLAIVLFYRIIPSANLLADALEIWVSTFYHCSLVDKWSCRDDQHFVKNPYNVQNHKMLAIESSI